MEDIKLAFETVVVGLMAFPWLLILAYILYYLFTRKNLFNKARGFWQDKEQPFALIGTFILGLAYCLGTVIFPLADDLFNESRNISGVEIKADGEIRTDVMMKAYYKDKFYKLDPKDFPGLPNVREIERKARAAGPKPTEEAMDEVTKGYHSIYNFQKYTVFNSPKGHEVLMPLHSRIVVLRGAVFNGLFLLGTLLLLTALAGLEALFRWIKARTRRVAEATSEGGDKVTDPTSEDSARVTDATSEGSAQTQSVGPVTGNWKTFAPRFIILILLSGLVLFLCREGAWGVTEAEKEYDKHVMGLFYGYKTNEAPNKIPWQEIEQQNKPAEKAPEQKP